MFETAAFAGLAVPGELTVVLGGVAAYEGHVPLAAIAASAVCGAIIGDSAGFYLGRRLGTVFLDSRLGRMLGRSRVETTMGKIRAGGIRVVIIGRFIGVLRAIMPFAAGASGMRYGRFVIASVIGATSWGIGFTLLGYFAGNSWRKVEGYAGAASKVLLALLVLVAVIVIAARKAAEHQVRIRAAWARFLDRPRIAGFRRRYRRQLGFVTRRFSPASAAGLQLTVSLLGLSVLGYLLAVLVGQVLGADGLVAIDEPVRRELAEGQAPWLIDTMRWVARLLNPATAWFAALVVGGYRWARDRRPRALVLLVGDVAGASMLTVAIREVVARSQEIQSFGGVRETSFPSERMTVAAALATGLLVVVVPRVRGWHNKVFVVALFVGTCLLAGFAVLYLARGYLTDVLGGLVLGAVWGWVVAMTVSIVWRSPTKPRPAVADVPAIESAP